MSVSTLSDNDDESNSFNKDKIYYESYHPLNYSDSDDESNSHKDNKTYYDWQNHPLNYCTHNFSFTQSLNNPNVYVRKSIYLDEQSRDPNVSKSLIFDYLEDIYAMFNRTNEMKAEMVFKLLDKQLSDYNITEIAILHEKEKENLKNDLDKKNKIKELSKELNHCKAQKDTPIHESINKDTISNYEKHIKNIEKDIILFKQVIQEQKSLISDLEYKLEKCERDKKSDKRDNESIIKRIKKERDDYLYSNEQYQKENENIIRETNDDMKKMKKECTKHLKQLKIQEEEIEQLNSTISKQNIKLEKAIEEKNNIILEHKKEKDLLFQEHENALALANNHIEKLVTIFDNSSKKENRVAKITSKDTLGLKNQIDENNKALSLLIKNQEKQQQQQQLIPPSSTLKETIQPSPLLPTTSGNNDNLQPSELPRDYYDVSTKSRLEQLGVNTTTLYNNPNNDNKTITKREANKAMQDESLKTENINTPLQKVQDEIEKEVATQNNQDHQLDSKIKISPA
ncbi:uncharacterized protein MCAP_0864-like [Palaemon carinicauda]|uniref:uncharacterized protein MCAP_0864-like n=1 Tax=Palaemon carinicauda TaxID=392227 RepID=UPI0035B64017